MAKSITDILCNCIKYIWFYSLSCCLLVSVASSAERPNRTIKEPGEKQVIAVVPITVLSIIPAQAEPGSKVILSGTGFGDNAFVFLGSTEIPARILDSRIAEFTIPLQLDAGLYALYLRRPDGVIGKTYNFSVLPLRPVLISLLPNSISSCTLGNEREVIAHGKNFSNSSLLFFDGAALASTIISPESISFRMPAVQSGLHQVQVKNAPENSSVSLNLAVETRPEIGQVTVGNEYVNYYELLIFGKNFTQNSSLYVDGVQLGGSQNPAEREKLIYMDCSKLVYQRHPYSPVNKDLRLQIVNQGGEGSQVITVTAP